MFLLLSFNSFYSLITSLSGSSFAQTIRDLSQVTQSITRWQDLTRSGWVLDEKTETEILKLASPWSIVLSQTVSRMRLAGVSILPSLTRILDLAKYQLHSIRMARSQSMQSEIQAYFSLFAVPLFSLVFYLFLPSLNEYKMTWIILTLCFTLLGILGLFWILNMTQNARFGGVKTCYKQVPFQFQIFLESLISFIKSGMPSDLAWEEVSLTFKQTYPEIEILIAESVWSEMRLIKVECKKTNEIGQLIEQIRKQIQDSLIQGQSVCEKLQFELEKFQSLYTSWIQTEVLSLGTKALKPLFICVAPSVFILMAVGLTLSLGDTIAYLE